MDKKTIKSDADKAAEEKLERAFDAFLLGSDEDDMQRLFSELSAAAEPAPPQSEQKEARFDPRYLPPTRRRNRQKRSMAPSIDPRRLPRSERALSKEPSIDLPPSKADDAKMEATQALLEGVDPEFTPTVRMRRSEVLTNIEEIWDTPQGPSEDDLDSEADDDGALEAAGQGAPADVPEAKAVERASEPDGKALMDMASELAVSAGSLQLALEDDFEDLEELGVESIAPIGDLPPIDDSLESTLQAFTEAVDALKDVGDLLESVEEPETQELSPEELEALYKAGPISVGDLGPYAPPTPPPTRDVGPVPEDIPLHDDPDQGYGDDYAPPMEARRKLPTAPTVAPIQGQPLDAFIGEARACTEQRFPLEGFFTLDARLGHMIRIAEELAQAHLQGKLHRGLRPGNVSIGEYHQVQLGGWLSADDAQDPTRGTTVLNLAEPDVSFYHIDDRVDLGAVGIVLESGEIVVGNPRFLPPEVATYGMKVYNEQSEIYAFGLLLFETLGLQPAFRGGAVSLVIDAVRGGKMADIRSVARQVELPRQIQSIIVKALQPAPEDRYITMEELLEDLRLAQLGELPSVYVPTLPQLAVQMAPKLALGGLIGGGVMALGGALALGLAPTDVDEGMKLAAERASHVAAMQVHTHQRASTIAAMLGDVEAQVRNLGSTAEPLLDHAGPMSGPLYRLYEFKTPGRQPEGLTTGLGYPGSISLTWPMYKIHPEASTSKANRTARTLQWLRPQVQEAFNPGALAPETLASQVEGGLHPVHRVFASLDMGLYMTFPGQDTVPEDYDPRSGHWASLEEGDLDVVWGVPMSDPLSDTPILPIAQTLLDSEGEVLGTVGMELNLHTLASDVLDPATLPGGSQAYVVNEEGRIILSQDMGLEGRGDVRVKSLPFPEVTVALGEDGGVVDLNAGGVGAFSPLGVGDLFLVVTLDEAHLMPPVHADQPDAIASGLLKDGPPS